MSEPILQALISAGSGLLGALIGFGGALIVSIRAGRIARDQVLYARAHERRDEALGTVFVMLHDLSNAFSEWAETPDSDSSYERGGRASTLIQEVTGHLRKTSVWLPMSISEEITALLEDYLRWLENPPDSDRAYDEVREQAREWYYQEAFSRETEIEFKIRKALGVEEPGDGAPRPWRRRGFGG